MATRGQSWSVVEVGTLLSSATPPLSPIRPQSLLTRTFASEYFKIHICQLFDKINEGPKRNNTFCAKNGEKYRLRIATFGAVALNGRRGSKIPKNANLRVTDSWGGIGIGGGV